MTTVTVGLCVKNAETTIEDSIESILDQDYPSELMEIIAVYGRSTDRTQLVLKEKLENSRIRSQILDDGGEGLGVARNIVCERANGKYILWIDGDIVIPKDHVRKQVVYMENNPHVGAAKATYGLMMTGNLVSDLESMRTIKVVGFIKPSNAPKQTELSGTGASIYRLRALREVKFFDRNIKGAGEDIDVAMRIIEKNWHLATSPALFYERFRTTWKELWKEYSWWGYGMHYVFSKHKGLIPLWSHVPLVAFMKGIFQAIAAYKLSRKKIMFLLPLHAFFKMSAWLLGFLRSHLESYGHSLTDHLRFEIIKELPSVVLDLNTKSLLPKVTVGICVKDAETIISESLASLQSQNYPKSLLEVIIVDDHSMDNTLAVVKEFAFSQESIKTKVFSTKIGGLGEGRQIIVDNATGKYIVWVDADITIPSNHIADQIGFMENKSDVAIAKGREISVSVDMVSRIESFRPLLHEYRWRDFSVGIGGSTCRVDALKQAGGFDETIRGAGEDIDIVTRIHEQGWQTVITPASFEHRLKSTWKGLWKQYFWYGYGAHLLKNKHKSEVFIFPYIPCFAFIFGILNFFYIFRKTNAVSSLLLPVQYAFKKSAWCFGYLRSHSAGYGHP